MAKAIFTVRSGSGYDDFPEKHYHFPRTYLNFVRQAVGDQIIYYEPRRSTGAGNSGGRQAYFATGYVTEIVSDPQRADHYYAHIAHYLDFDQPVPFNIEGQYFERGLQKVDGKANKGAFGRAVRLVPDDQFELIWRAGFSEELADRTAVEHPINGFYEPGAAFVRPIVELTVQRPFRDQAFKRAVRLAYGNCCALTGISLINGGGRPEVQAAHIQPVASEGPDTVRNGLALSGTFHWLFDRGLISISDDYRILVAKGHVPDQVQSMLNRDGRIIYPRELGARPNPYYLKFHRENIFKG